LTLFSICIPNFNYAHYIRLTIASVQAQDQPFEIRVADNCSTDDSVAVIQAIADPRIFISTNPWNVGFAGNLDRACAGATGDRMILLSSDDLMEPGALSHYARLAEALGDAAETAIFNATQHVIDGEGRRTGIMGRNPRLWAGAVEDAALSSAVGAPVWRIPAATLLRQSILDMRVPFAFAATCYSRALYDSVCGYGGSRLYNPDKHFAWKLLTRADTAFHIDAPLFAYRVHNANQDAQQSQSGALKHLVDEYVASFDQPPETLAKAQLGKDEVAAAFVEQDIALRGLKMLAEGRRIDARRTLAFGQATYPALVRASRNCTALRALLALGPVGSGIAHAQYQKRAAVWQAGTGH
jgi:glycosyltransferase involved in cell wall biosynthesis